MNKREQLSKQLTQINRSSRAFECVRLAETKSKLTTFAACRSTSTTATAATATTATAMARSTA